MAHPVYYNIDMRVQRVGDYYVGFYFDMTQLARYWNCDGQPRFYHHTGAVSNYYGLREALSEYAAEGSHEVCTQVTLQDIISVFTNFDPNSQQIKHMRRNCRASINN